MASNITVTIAIGQDGVTRYYVNNTESLMQKHLPIKMQERVW